MLYTMSMSVNQNNPENQINNESADDRRVNVDYLRMFNVVPESPREVRTARIVQPGGPFIGRQFNPFGMPEDLQVCDDYGLVNSSRSPDSGELEAMRAHALDVVAGFYSFLAPKSRNYLFAALPSAEFREDDDIGPHIYIELPKDIRMIVNLNELGEVLSLAIVHPDYLQYRPRRYSKGSDIFSQKQIMPEVIMVQQEGQYTNVSLHGYVHQDPMKDPRKQEEGKNELEPGIWPMTDYDFEFLVGVLGPIVKTMEIHEQLDLQIALAALNEIKSGNGQLVEDPNVREFLQRFGVRLPAFWPNYQNGQVEEMRRNLNEALSEWGSSQAWPTGIVGKCFRRWYDEQGRKNTVGVPLKVIRSRFAAAYQKFLLEHMLKSEQNTS